MDPNQLDRMMNCWCPPANEKSDDAERQQVTQTSPPASPPPTEERLFTNWSSKDSPRERANQ